MLLTYSLYRMGCINTRPAQKLLIRGKFTGNPYSYVCERRLYRHCNTLRVPRQCQTRTRVCVNAALGWFGATASGQIMNSVYVCVYSYSMRVHM